MRTPLRRFTTFALTGLAATLLGTTAATAAPHTTTAATTGSEQWITVSPDRGVPGEHASIQIACDRATGPVHSTALATTMPARNPDGHQPWALFATGVVRNVAPGRYPVTVDCGTNRLATTFTVQPVPTREGLLTGIRTGAHRTFDRVVLDLAGPRPAATARYVDRLTADPSGRPVALPCGVAHERFLLATARPAAAHDDNGRLTYRGPRTFCTPALRNIRAVAITGDFENVLSIGTGLRHRSWVHVFTLTHPTRVVIDVGR